MKGARMVLDVRAHATGPVVTTVVRTVRHHAGWQSAKYRGAVYQVHPSVLGFRYIVIGRPTETVSRDTNAPR